MTGTTPQIDDVVAQRYLSVVNEPNRTITVAIGKPRPDPDPTGDWMCLLRIEGLDSPRSQFVHGIDSLQALLLAAEVARSALDASGLSLSWLGGEPGETGIPRTVPIYFGRKFAEDIERYIDQQINAFAQTVEKRAPSQR